MKPSIAVVLTVSAVLSVGSTTVAADWKKLLEKVPSAVTGDAGPGVGSLTNSEMVNGLKEALMQGAQRAIGSLGKLDGFLGNDQVRIPMPKPLKTVESTLRTFGQDRYADEFITSMNRAAEDAVPEAADILSNTIKQMTVDDAKSILNGPSNAATQYFRKSSTSDLVERFKPIVAGATERVGVTNSYKALVDQAGPAASLVDSSATDIDGYVTEKAVDGLFKLIEAEEKRIRANPVARTTDLLKKVFAK